MITPGEEEPHPWWAWLIPTIVAATFWAFGEIVCDEIIEAATHSTEPDKATKSTTQPEVTGTALLPVGKSLLQETTMRDKSVLSSSEEDTTVPDVNSTPPLTNKDTAASQSAAHNQVKLRAHNRPLEKISGELDYMIAGLVDFVLVLCLWPVVLGHFRVDSPLPLREEVALPTAATITALGAGVFQSLSWLMHARAFELAPSTELVPLTQLTSIFLFLFDLAQYLVQLGEGDGKSQVATMELVALALIIIGSVKPSTRSAWQLIEPNFWRKQSVMHMVASCALSAFFYHTMALLLASGMTEQQFLILSTSGSVPTCCAVAILDRRAREVLKLLWHRGVSCRVLSLAVLSESASLVATFVISFAYRMHHRDLASGAVVNATCDALVLFINLMVAQLLWSALQFGRRVESPSNKLASWIVVTFGLFLANVPPSYAARVLGIEIVLNL